MADNPYTIKSLPGIKRDGTRFENGFYVDGQWCRFQRGLPRKMGGYRRVSAELPEISRGLNSYNQNAQVSLISGGASTLTQLTLNINGIATAKYNRTPVAFPANAKYLWTFDTQFDSVGVYPGGYLLAHPGQNLAEIDSDATSPLYVGLVTDSAVLTEVTGASAPTPVSGGVVSLYPYAFLFGSDGFVAWSVPNNPQDWTGTGSGEANITAQKIVAALPLRAGPGNAPAGLFWSLDSLVRCTFVGGEAIFQFDTLTSQSSILSSQCVIEYDGIFYWVGVDRFLMFNGVVREIPNQLNQNWFFDNLNYAQRQKVFAYKVPRFGEIWWCYPRGDATECTHAVIYNLRENTWYDTELPNGGRSCGEFVTVYEYPFMTGVNVGVDPTPTFSTTSVTMGTGSKSFTVVTGLNYTVGMIIVISYDASNYMTGFISSYIAGTGALVVDVTSIVGSGTYASWTMEATGTYNLWQHEYGVDELDGTLINSIPSYFQTADISFVADPQQPKNRSMRCTMIEPDFVQNGDMTVQITGRANARAPEVTSEEKTFPEVATTPHEQVVFFKEIRREMRFIFKSNVVGGNYQMGQCIAHIDVGDGTVLG
jgi:hypothetical protein